MRPIVRVAITTLACLCALLALWVRAENAIGVRYDVPAAGAGAGARAEVEETWGSYDPDTLYHARRVARGTLSDGWITAHDLRLGHPHAAGSLGAPIPWPPAYDLFLTALARGALPDIRALFPDANGTAPTEAADGKEERLTLRERARIERLVSTVPMVCGALAAFLAALWAAGLAYRLAHEERRELTALCATLFAGVTVAMTFGHARYSHLGNGDHHAFVSLLHLLLLGLTTSALTRERVVQPVRGAIRGGLAGVIAGVLITTWTASILWVALVQLALLVRLVLPFPGGDTAAEDAGGGDGGVDGAGGQVGRKARAEGLPLFATSFHKAALLVVIPGVLDSPFSSTTPFSLVDLSWFHMVWLVAGWLVFAPYAMAPRLVAGRKLLMAVPAAAVALLVVLFTDAPAQLAEAFSWAGASNVFMGSINESQPLIGAGGSFAKLVKYAGFGVVLAPLVWIAALRRTARAPQLLPWVTALPVVLLLAVLQRRFAEAAAGPLAVLLGVLVAVWTVELLARRGPVTRRAGIGAAVALGVLALAANPWTLRNTWTRMTLRHATGERFVTVTDVAHRQRILAEVLNGLAPEVDPGADPDADLDAASAILAEWDLGHAIEWRAQRPSIATNFGPYIGEESFLAPWRFFAEADAERAEAFLRERGVGAVLVDRNTPARRPTMAAALEDPSLLGPAWSRTMAARMLADGAGAGEPEEVPGFLRLARFVEDPRGGTVRVYEVVQGARIRAVARSLDVVVTLAGEDGASTVWRGSARAAAAPGGPQTLVVRCPHAPTGPTGGARGPRGAVRVLSLEVFVDGAAVPLEFPGKAVDEGLWVDIAR